jgi:prepilin-type N-terminal cleavage/methylation domain-containing protein
VKSVKSVDPQSAIRNPQSAISPRLAFTLVEMLVVVVIISIMSVAIIAEMRGTFQDALLRSTSRELAGAFNLASSRAISINRPLRVRLDTLAHRWLLERSTRGGTDFYPVRDLPGSFGTLDARIAIASGTGRQLRRTTPARNRPKIPANPAARHPPGWRRPSPFIRTERRTPGRSSWPTAMVSASRCASTRSPRACKLQAMERP